MHFKGMNQGLSKTQRTEYLSDARIGDRIKQNTVPFSIYYLNENTCTFQGIKFTFIC